MTAKNAIRAIEKVAAEVGHPQLTDLGWPPVADARLFDQLDSLDWMFSDVGPQTAATGMLGLIHGRFVPAVRMRRSEGPPEPDEWVGPSGVGGLFGALDVGYRKDIVYWRNDVNSLETQLRGRVQVALRPPARHEVIKSSHDAVDYFPLASENRRVFVSYAGNDRNLAEQLVAVLRGHFPTVFDYLDRGESLPPGSEWREKIKKEILAAQFGILLISPAYIKAERPRKMLSLDGGGIRGVITLRVLRRLEELVAQPHNIVLDPRDPGSAFTFVDGGTTAYNNPAFLHYRMATADPYHLQWPTGEGKLLLVSVGTGISPAAAQHASRPGLGFVGNVKATLDALMHQAAVDQDINCRVVGRCMHGHHLDYEIGDLILRDEQGEKTPATTNMGRDFLYLRYNTYLTERHLGDLGIEGIDVKSIRKLDVASGTAIAQLSDIGDALARQVDPADFGSFMNAPAGQDR